MSNRFLFARNDSKVALVYNGVDLQEYKLFDQPTRQAVFTVGYFGRIHPRKGIEVLVKAMRRVSGQSQLVIQGDGEAAYLASLKELARGLPVEFKPYSTDPRKDMAGVDVIVLPSIRWEGLSRVILEAMALGKVIIASDLAENREAIGEDSDLVTFPVGDSEALAKIIGNIREGKISWQETILKHRKRAERLFDVRKNTLKIEHIYKDLLGVGNDPGNVVAQSCFVCPDCKGGLILDTDLYVCADCGVRWAVKEGIPVFLKHIPAYWGEFSREEMCRINTLARETGWRSTIQSEFPAHLRDFVLEESRANWQYFVESNTAGAILDAGSGWGTLAFSLARTGATIYALEPVWERIQFIKIRQVQEQLPNVLPVCAGIKALPFPDSSFDVVILNGVLEWVGVSESELAPNLVQEKCLKEVFRVLKPGGSLYIGVENRFSFFYFFGVKDPHSRTPFTTVVPRIIANVICLCLKGKPYRTYIYSFSGYRRLLRKTGFQAIDFYLPVPSYLHIKYLVPLKNDKVLDYWIRHPMSGNLLFTPRLVRIIYVLLKMFTACPVTRKMIKYFVPDYAIVARKKSVHENRDQ